MKLSYLVPLAIISCSLSLPAQAAGSALRIICNGDDVGAEVYVNGKFRGECPVDIQVPAGTLKLLVQKKIDASRIRSFEQEIRMADDSVKKVEAVLTEQLTAEGLRLAQEAQKRQEEEERVRVEAQQRQVNERKAYLASLIPNLEANMVAIPGKNYAMGKYEVTQGEWEAVMGDNPSHFKQCGDNCPVENVSYSDVDIFIHRLNKKTGMEYRLPSESEWWDACYGKKGGGLFSGSKYCGGDDIESVAWYSSNSNEKTHPVGLKQPNDFGLYDMSGNVSELSTDFRYWVVLFGGAWSTGLKDMSTGNAILFNNGETMPSIRGFRLARTLP